ncbi:MAG: hypothetical protein R6W48_11475 [Gaiellaceae bacterium]
MVAVAGLVAVLAGCGGAARTTEGAVEPPRLASVLALLPDEPELRRHLLVGDLERLRAAYTEPARLEWALDGVWLPDALGGARSSLWRTTFGIDLADVTRFASAGFHPAEVAVLEGSFKPTRVRSALSRYGYRERGGVLARGEDGSIDPSTEAGRLALGSLNRVVVSPSTILGASTTALARAAGSSSSRPGEHSDLAALTAALGPVTSAIVLDVSFVRPPSGAPATIIPRHEARLLAAGIDDGGPGRRTLRIALLYEDETNAADDTALIEDRLAETELPGLPGTRFADVAHGWSVARSGRAVRITAMLPPATGPWVWRDLVERGDLAVLVRPAS